MAKTLAEALRDEARLCEPTGRSWGAILAKGLPHYEMKVHHVNVRWYQHENGRWVVRVSSCGSVTSESFDTKREAWDEGRRMAREAADFDLSRGYIRRPKGGVA